MSLDGGVVVDISVRRVVFVVIGDVVDVDTISGQVRERGVHVHCDALTAAQFCHGTCQLAFVLT